MDESLVVEKPGLNGYCPYCGARMVKVSMADNDWGSTWAWECVVCAAEITHTRIPPEVGDEYLDR